MIEFPESSCELLLMSLVFGCLVWFLNSNGRKKSLLTLWLFYKRAAALISCTASLTADIFLLGFVFRQRVHVRAGQINKFVLCFTQSTNPIASCSVLFIYTFLLFSGFVTLLPSLSLACTVQKQVACARVSFWTFFIRLLSLSLSLQSLPINPLKRRPLCFQRRRAVCAPAFELLLKHVSEGCVQQGDKRFLPHQYSAFGWGGSLHMSCRSPSYCTTAAALFLDPLEELIVRFCSRRSVWCGEVSNGQYVGQV